MTRAHIPGGWRTLFVALAATWGSSFLFIKALGALVLLSGIAISQGRLTAAGSAGESGSPGR